MAGGGGSGPKETALDKELATIGVERYSRAKKVFQPIEDYAISKTLGNRESQDSLSQGMSQANYEQQFGYNIDPTVRAVASQSAGTLNSGAGKLGLAQAAMDKGTARGLGAVDTSLGSERNYYGNIQSLVNIGQGKSDQALTGLNRAANASQNQAIIDARASAAAKNAFLDVVGTAGGYAAGGLSRVPASSGPLPSGLGPVPQVGYIKE